MGRAPCLKWDEWSPGLEDDGMTLRQMMETMPQHSADAVPEIVRKYEHPDSPDALAGAITLERHDRLHCILGRGLHPESDEPWLIGVTMGADEKLTDEDVETMRVVSTTLYPEAWRFSEASLHAFNLGIGFGQTRLRNKNIHLMPFEEAPLMDMTPSAIRKLLGLVDEDIRAYFRKEAILLPGTPQSQRLDTSVHRSDQALRQPAD